MHSTVPLTQRFLITGHVQGVWYRASMCEQAQALGVRGWVRNRQDGSVEALCHGTVAQLQALLAWSRRGPPKARVDAVDVQDVPAEALAPTFVQRPSV